MKRTEEASADVGGPVDEAAVSLAVYGDTLKPKEVSALLGMEPTSCFEPGHKPGPRSPPIAHGAWFYQVRAKPPFDLDDLATMLLARLPADESVWKALCSQYRVQVRVALHLESWNRGFGFSHATLKLLSGIGADINFDIYAYGDRDA